MRHLFSARIAFARVVEVSVAAFLILSFLAVFVSFDLRRNEDINIEKTVFDSFEYFYLSGDLGSSVSSGNLSLLNQSFRNVVPRIYNVDIGMKTKNETVKPDIPPGRNVRAYSYLVFGPQNKLNPAVFTLYLW